MRQAEAEAGISLEDSYYVNDYPVTDKTKQALERAGVSLPETAEVVETPVEAASPMADAEPQEPEAEVTADTQAGEPEPPDRLDELNKKVGQLINENAELRRALSDQPDPTEQFQEWIAQAQAAQQGQYTPDQFEQLLEDDPATATMIAHQRGDQFGYARAWQQWNQVSPGAPQIWADNQNLKAQLAEFQQNIGQQIAPARAAAGRQELTDAMSAVAARHDDYAEVMSSATEDDLKAFVSNNPLMAEVLEKGLLGDQRSKEQVYETLYRWRKADIGDQLVRAAREAPARQSEEAREAKREAFVGSASTTTPDEVPESEQERLSRVWRETRPSLRDAWENRGPSRVGR